MTHIFLAEIGTEELPPKMLRTLAENFSTHIIDELNSNNISHGEVHWFASPQRLAIKVTALSNAQTDMHFEKRGPSITKAFDSNGKPTKATKSWANAYGINIDQAERLITDSGEWLVYRARMKGQLVQTLLFNIVNKALSKLKIKKMMRWGDKNIKFIRPVHTVTLLLDDKVITGKILGIDSDRVVRSHRFMGCGEIILDHANKYQEALFMQGKVIVNYHQRKEIIRRHVKLAALNIGGVTDLNDNLLEEVTSLVEWPVVLTARFEEKFLTIPMEVLVCTMIENQKYFPVYDTKGTLLPYFIFVANIVSKDPQQIISGNEKVIRSRLEDIEFFFNTDRKQRLEDRLSYLDNVLFKKQLGSMKDKSHRIANLAAWIAEQIGANIQQASRAGLLSKCDLITKMVLEFSETQGIMGMYYARYDGEQEAVAIAQKEQYQPRFIGDKIPTTQVSCAVAIADKIDTLVGIFGINRHPKGDKDPFALRRAALGILRIIIEKQLTLDLKTLTEQAVNVYGKKLTNTTVINDVIDFILNRLRAWYQEQGHNIDTIQAVLAKCSNCPTDVDARIRAISFFRTLEVSTSLVAANKRILNILIQSNENFNKDLQASLLKDPAEIMLAIHLNVLREKLCSLCEAGLYHDVLLELSTLCEPIDSFFKNVMVMVDNDDIRINRLTLLDQLHKLFLQVADISLLK
ncbi:glycine--tRNA ligase subunit beta [Candidatus Curculioniphilus buchneri]|uniref:glycine--tRNA ligase subunit beta n=1 Tax=Candidatus Curculioniphilus buchneri TaxID=690594 RepID=UPI00376EEE4D